MPHSSGDDGCDELFIPLDWVKFMVWYMLSTILMALGGIVVYIYYLRKGQFDDIEDVKYQMFRENNCDDEV